MNRTITITARAFTGETPRPYRVRVDDDGVVRVYDSVARHYTANHILSKSIVRRLAVQARVFV